MCGSQPHIYTISTQRSRAYIRYITEPWDYLRKPRKGEPAWGPLRTHAGLAPLATGMCAAHALYGRLSGSAALRKSLKVDSNGQL